MKNGVSLPKEVVFTSINFSRPFTSNDKTSKPRPSPCVTDNMLDLFCELWFTQRAEAPSLVLDDKFFAGKPER
jgi:hypothetical protein